MSSEKPTSQIETASPHTLVENANSTLTSSGQSFKNNRQLRPQTEIEPDLKVSQEGKETSKSQQSESINVGAERNIISETKPRSGKPSPEPVSRTSDQSQMSFIENSISRKDEEKRSVNVESSEEEPKSKTKPNSGQDHQVRSSAHSTERQNLTNTSSLNREINAAVAQNFETETQNSKKLNHFGEDSKLGTATATPRVMVMHAAENNKEGAKNHRADDNRTPSKPSTPANVSSANNSNGNNPGFDNQNLSQERWMNQNGLNGFGKVSQEGNEDPSIFSAPQVRDANAVTVSSQTAAKAEMPQRTGDRFEQFSENLVKEVAKLRPLRNGAIQLSVNTGSKELVINLVQKGEWVEARLMTDGDDSAQLIKNLSHMNDVLSRHQIRVLTTNDEKFDSSQSQNNLESSKEENNRGARQTKDEGHSDNQDFQEQSELSEKLRDSSESTLVEESSDAQEVLNQFA